MPTAQVAEGLRVPRQVGRLRQFHRALLVTSRGVFVGFNRRFIVLVDEVLRSWLSANANGHFNTFRHSRLHNTEPPHELERLRSCLVEVAGRLGRDDTEPVHGYALLPRVVDRVLKHGTPSKLE